MNRALIRHHAAIRRRQQIEILMITVFFTAISSVWLGFALISAIMGV